MRTVLSWLAVVTGAGIVAMTAAVAASLITHGGSSDPAFWGVDIALLTTLVGGCIAVRWMSGLILRVCDMAMRPLPVRYGTEPAALPGVRQGPSALALSRSHKHAYDIQALAKAAPRAFSGDADEDTRWLSATDGMGMPTAMAVSGRWPFRPRRPGMAPRVLTMFTPEGDGHRVVSALLTRRGREVTVERAVVLDSDDLARNVASALRLAGLAPDGASADWVPRAWVELQEDGVVKLRLPDVWLRPDDKQDLTFRVQMRSLLFPHSISSAADEDGDALWGAVTSGRRVRPASGSACWGSSGAARRCSSTAETYLVRLDRDTVERRRPGLRAARLLGTDVVLAGIRNGLITDIATKSAMLAALLSGRILVEMIAEARYMTSDAVTAALRAPER